METKAASLVAILPCEPVPETAGEHYARIKLRRQKKGLSLDENDLWIAATRLALGATLVSRDSDFRQNRWVERGRLDALRYPMEARGDFRNLELEIPVEPRKSTILLTDPFSGRMTQLLLVERKF